MHHEKNIYTYMYPFSLCQMFIRMEKKTCKLSDTSMNDYLSTSLVGSLLMCHTTPKPQDLSHKPCIAMSDPSAL